MLARKLQRATATARALTRGYVRALAGRWRYCIACEHRVPTFLPWRGGQAGAPPLMRALRIVGSDRENHACPRCRATDRERHLKLYLQRTGLSKRIAGARILHIAPESGLSAWVRSMSPREYVLGDLHPSSELVRRIDLERTTFAPGSFNIVIANHVLEHVSSLPAATAELTRILAPGGFAILQVPYAKGLEQTLDDPTVIDPEARLQLYGQEDHVRLFGRDVYARIATAQLVAQPITHDTVLGDIDPYRYGVNAEEELMLFQRL